MWWNKPDKSEYLQGSISATKSRPTLSTSPIDEIKPQESQDNGAPVGSTFFTINPETSKVIADVSNESPNVKSYDLCPPELLGVRCKVCGQDKFKCSCVSESSEPFDLLKEMNDPGMTDVFDSTKVVRKKSSSSKPRLDIDDSSAEDNDGPGLGLFKFIIPASLMILVYFIIIKPVFDNVFEVAQSVNSTDIATTSLTSTAWQLVPWLMVPLFIFIILSVFGFGHD